MGLQRHSAPNGQIDGRMVREIASQTVFVRLPMNLEYFSGINNIPLRRSAKRLRGVVPEELMLFLL